MAFIRYMLYTLRYMVSTFSIKNQHYILSVSIMALFKIATLQIKCTLFTWTKVSTLNNVNPHYFESYFRFYTNSKCRFELWGSYKKRIVSLCWPFGHHCGSWHFWACLFPEALHPCTTPPWEQGSHTLDSAGSMSCSPPPSAAALAPSCLSMWALEYTTTYHSIAYYPQSTHIFSLQPL